MSTRSCRCRAAGLAVGALVDRVGRRGVGRLLCDAQQLVPAIEHIARVAGRLQLSAIVVANRPWHVHRPPGRCHDGQGGGPGAPHPGDPHPESDLVATRCAIHGRTVAIPRRCAAKSCTTWWYWVVLDCNGNRSSSWRSPSLHRRHRRRGRVRPRRQATAHCGSASSSSSAICARLPGPAFAAPSLSAMVELAAVAFVARTISACGCRRGNRCTCGAATRTMIVLEAVVVASSHSATRRPRRARGRDVSPAPGRAPYRESGRAPAVDDVVVLSDSRRVEPILRGARSARTSSATGGR